MIVALLFIGFGAGVLILINRDDAYVTDAWKIITAPWGVMSDCINCGPGKYFVGQCPVCGPEKKLAALVEKLKTESELRADNDELKAERDALREKLAKHEAI